MCAKELPTEIIFTSALCRQAFYITSHTESAKIRLKCRLQGESRQMKAHTQYRQGIAHMSCPAPVPRPCISLSALVLGIIEIIDRPVSIVD